MVRYNNSDKVTVDSVVIDYGTYPDYTKSINSPHLSPDFCPLDQRKENAARLRQLISKDMQKRKDWYRWSIGVAEYFAGNFNRAEDIVCELISNMMDGKAETYDYLVDDSKSPLEDRRLMRWWYISIKNQFIDSTRVTRYKELGNIESGNDIIEKMYVPKLLESPIEQVAKREMIEKTMAILQGLNVSYRELIFMHYFNGLSYREMAEILHVPMGTAKRRLHTAMQEFIVKLAQTK